MIKNNKYWLISLSIFFLLSVGHRHIFAEESIPADTARWQAAALFARKLSQEINDKAAFLEKYINKDELQRIIDGRIN
ncbi:MAG: hypothetical protein GY860_13875 [Desulfobacteraceae bacterium]|nr:hypothetical protein [Desulfobacteraceae bacterium]